VVSERRNRHAIHCKEEFKGGHLMESGHIEDRYGRMILKYVLMEVDGRICVGFETTSVYML
jgi:hypothetical protein